MEDLDRVNSSRRVEQRQLADLARLGIEWDGAVVRQSDRFPRYDEVIGQLVDQELTYPCFCTRREIRGAAVAPHGESPDGAYPGTCRHLSAAERARRAAERPAALRLRTDRSPLTITDELLGSYSATLDDFVVRRNDGVPAYHVAVVVDDADQGVTEVVRGDDLLPSTPRHVYLQRLLGVPTPRYLHVPLVVGPSGDRLAKRDGAVTLADLAGEGIDSDLVRSALAASLRLAECGEPVTPHQLVDRFSDSTLVSAGRGAVSLASLERCFTGEFQRHPG
jgi:glutamyl-tRNA synthetase